MIPADPGSFALLRSSYSLLSLEYTVPWGFSSLPLGRNFTAANQLQVINVCLLLRPLKRFKIPVKLEKG